MAVSDFLPFLWIPDAFLCFGFHTSFRGNDRISAVPITYLSSASPSSQTGGCRHTLTIAVMAVLSAVLGSTSTISNLIIISQLNHFTFVSALLFPVLRLSLSLGVSIVKDNAVIVLTSTALPAHQAVRMFLLHRCDAVNETIQPTF